MSAEQPQITKAKLLFFQELDRDVDFLGTVIPGNKNIKICHHFVYSYLTEIGIFPDIYYGNDLPSQLYARHNFAPVGGAPIAGDVILLGGDSHSMIALAPDIWVGVNNLGFFGNSLPFEHSTQLSKRCVIQIVGEDMSQRTLNLKHYPSDRYPVSFQVYRHNRQTFPPFEKSKLKGRWNAVSSGGCEVI